MKIKPFVKLSFSSSMVYTNRCVTLFFTSNGTRIALIGPKDSYLTSFGPFHILELPLSLQQRGQKDIAVILLSTFFYSKTNKIHCYGQPSFFCSYFGVYYCYVIPVRSNQWKHGKREVYYLPLFSFWGILSL